MVTLSVAGRLKAPESNYPRPPLPRPRSPHRPQAFVPAGAEDLGGSNPARGGHLARTHAGVGKDGEGERRVPAKHFHRVQAPSYNEPVQRR